MKIVLLCVALAACSTVSPFIKPITSCAGKSVAAADVNEAFGDLLTQNWADLTAEGTRIGFDILACIIADITTQTPGLAPAAGTFKSLHAVEFRAAGVSCNEASKSSPEIGTGPEPTRGHVGNPSSACDSKRGAGDGLSTPSGCYRWIASRTDWRASRWVAVR